MTEIPKDKISCKICKYRGESPISGTCEGCNYFSKFEIDYDKVCKWCYNPVAEGDNICALCDFSFMPSQCDIYKKYGCQSNHCYKLVKEDNTIMDKKRKCPRCGSDSFVTERRPNGDSVCSKCNFSGKASEFYKEEKPKMKFSDLNFKFITNTFERNCRLMTALEKINRPVKDKDAFIKALFVKISENETLYLNNNAFHLFDSLESKEVTFEEAIKLIESCEPEVKKPSGNFVEYDIDENGCYHPLNDRGSSSICRWQDIHHYEDLNRIFAGWLWVHPDKPRNNCWSTSRMGIWNNELTTASYTWEYPLIPTKIRFWVKD